MRKLPIFLIVLLYGMVVAAYAQRIPENRITLSFKNDSLHHVLRAIGETQPGNRLNVMYIPDKMKQSKLVTASLKDATLTEALEQVLKGQPIYKDFQIIEYSSTFRVVYLTQQFITGDRYFDKGRKVAKFYDVGDELPNIPFPIENYHKPNALLSDFRGKLLILDMWGVNCSGCIAAFPKMEALQKKFGDKIQIILATKDSKAMVDELRTRVANVRETTLPIVTGENPLAYLFDYQGVPIHYWVDEKGVLKYITRHTTEELIADYLAGKDLNLAVKRDTSFYTGYDRPIAVGLNAIQGANFGISSYMAPHNDSVYNYSFINSYSVADTEPVKSYKTSAASLHRLYKFAYNITESGGYENEYFADSRIIIEAENPSQYMPVWGHYNQNVYDFELIVKNKKLKFAQFLELMRLQLDTYFGLQSQWEERDLACFVLKKVGDTKKLLTENGDNAYDVKNDALSGTNVMWWKVIRDINRKRSVLPQLIDETGMDPETMVDIEMSIAFDTDLAAVNRSLTPYGLAVEKATRRRKVIVLRE